ncbi:thioredoxin family protein [Granulosicoccus antarcticus]|uniref:Thioredoxin C-1 n=1 Tax=Granulosicoccus antarcticus IMCC3135 TaxID=1192854 RepID=A0A2Z2NLR9_9GAMM|nr:co-chaperone YbbN [Granulosicoccus antarcticus]ASJ72382.1 Thioredoxin C-1 [Granulosicoccus antarcticus IMCC3135]
MADSPHIVQLDEQNFMQVVVEGSDTTPVLVDFWADWCAPCKSLMPILEKLAIEYNGAFILAKLDTEANPGIAQQLGIRSLPTVKLFKDRQLVNEFMGALPESEVRAFIEANIGPALPATPEETEEDTDDSQVSIAMNLFEQGQAEEARTLLQQAQAEDPENVEVLLSLGQVCISMGDLETAESCLNALPESDRTGAQGLRLAGILELAKESDASISPQTLEAELEKDPSSSENRYKLAIALALAGNIQAAMDHLLKLVQTEPGYNEGAPREKLLALFNVLGDDPLVGQYRRKLFALLH